MCPSLELDVSATASNSDTFSEFSCENIEIFVWAQIVLILFLGLKKEIKKLSSSIDGDI